jgi:hypothetical protein
LGEIDLPSGTPEEDVPTKAMPATARLARAVNEYRQAIEQHGVKP